MRAPAAANSSGSRWKRTSLRARTSSESSAFAEGQSSDIPLLYIHGGFGYGKTHLLNAAALEFRKRGKKTLFLRAEDFMRQFLGALSRRETLSFKEELRAADLLLIDDLQHLCRARARLRIRPDLRNPP